MATGVYPSTRIYPSQTLYPRTPSEDDELVTLTGTNGTRIQLLAVTSVTATQDTRARVHSPITGGYLLDVNAPFGPQTITLTVLVRTFATWTALRDLYASGVIVTLSDTGNPWNGLRHNAVGTLSYRSIARPGQAALIEATIEVIPR